MGVPAFFQWLRERYPTIMHEVLEGSALDGAAAEAAEAALDEPGAPPLVQACDNFYLDLNGIIHPCCHPETGEQPRDEEQMVEWVQAHIDRRVLPCHE